MSILEEVLARGIVRSKRELSRLIGRPQNYVCERAGYFVPHDLIEMRIHLLKVGGHDDLIHRLEGMILSSWRAV
jgi:hypothetical protein